MIEQLVLPGISGDITAHAHTVNELGAHNSIAVHGLGSMSLQAVQEAHDIVAQYGRYSSINRINNLAWIDFPDIATQACWVKQQQQTTFISVGREQRGAHRYTFESVSDILANGELEYYTVRWLRRFLPVDRPHPPREANRTDAIRSIVPLLPKLSERAYMRQAVRQMPSLASHYNTFGYSFKAT